MSKTGITYLSKAGYIPKHSFSDHQFCEHCQYNKQVANPHPTSVLRESSLLDLVHSDICGPMPHQSLCGASYFLTFIDDATRKVWAYPTRTKDRVFTIFKDWLAMVENQMDRKLKCLRFNNGGEYKSDEFIQFCRERGIRREFTAAYSPEQNGVAKRMNRTIQEWIVSMLHHSGLSEGFWAEALLTALYIINMSPSRPLGSKIPQELWTRRKPDYGKLRIFGCEAYALVPRNATRNRSKSRGSVTCNYYKKLGHVVEPFGSRSLHDLGGNH
jgi:hypothetical protein